MTEPRNLIVQRNLHRMLRELVRDTATVEAEMNAFKERYTGEDLALVLSSSYWENQSKALADRQKAMAKLAENYGLLEWFIETAEHLFKAQAEKLQHLSPEECNTCPQ